MQRDSDEEAWRAIVDNYGDRVELDDDPAVDALPQPTAEPGLERLFRPLPQPDDDLGDELGDELGDGDDLDDERFVPPVPPPLPALPPDRLMAWAALFGAPTVLLVCLVAGIHLAQWLGYLLVASFIGGFVYLVVKMPRGPADPWDDGARL